MFPDYTSHNIGLRVMGPSYDTNHTASQVNPVKPVCPVAYMKMVSALNLQFLEAMQHGQRVQDSAEDGFDEEDAFQPTIQRSEPLSHTVALPSYALDGAFREEYPSLNRLPIQAAHSIAMLVFGKDHLTEEEFEALATSWGYWFATLPATTLKMLNFALELYNASKTMTPEELAEKIQSELTVDREVSLKMVAETMQNVRTFLADEPQMCLSFTALLQKIVSGMEEDPVKAAQCASLLAAFSRKTNVSRAVISAGLTMYQGNSDLMAKLLDQLKNSDGLVFNAMHAAATLLNATNSETSAQLTTGIDVVNDVLARRPDLSRDILRLAQNGFDANSGLTEELDLAVQRFHATLKSNPAIGRVLINDFLPKVAPQIWNLNVGKLGRLSLTGLARLNETGIKPFNLNQDQIEQRLKLCEIVEQIYEESKRSDAAPAKVVELSIESAITEVPTPEVPVLAPIVQDPIVTTTIWTSFVAKGREELPHIGNGWANRTGSELVEAAWKLKKEDIEAFAEITPEKGYEVVKGGVKAFFIIGGEVILSAALRITYEAVKDTIEMKVPATKGYIPAYWMVTTATQVGKTVVSYAVSKDSEKSLTTSMTNLVVHQAGAYAGPYIAQKVTKTPVVSPFLAGVISGIFVKLATEAFERKR